MNYQDYIKSELLILVPVLYVLGMGIKKSNIADKWIPLILGTVSVLLSALWVVANSECNSPSALAAALFTAVTQGILIAGATVYANQLYVQARKK